jgi:phenylalanyl-tRNA synthetase alpha chain
MIRAGIACPAGDFMADDIAELRTVALAGVAGAEDLRALDAVRVQILGKSGALTALLKTLGEATPDQRRERGAALNHLRDEIAGAIDARRVVLEQAAIAARIASEAVDVSLPVAAESAGSMHPISRTIDEMVAIFGAMGFSLREGPHIESDWHNFSALNIAPHHPARDDHDTFYLPGEMGGRTKVLRTHTSPVQIRTMLGEAPPIRVIVPGRTFRADHDATHSPMFHQCEALAIDRTITLAHLKGCIIDFLRAFFGLADLPVRFRASYFPFTEPSMEVDIAWNRASGEIGAGTDWLEILGSGMVHPNVLANVGIDPREWQGFAFGMGIERLTMLKYGMADLRPFYESDLRWLRHYGFSPFAGASLHEGFGSFEGRAP